MIANPSRGGTDRTSQITTGQDPSHRNSGTLTLTLSQDRSGVRRHHGVSPDRVLVIE